MNLVDNQKELVTLTIKDFCAQKGIISIVPVVRENENGYPYITFMNKENKGENIYFSKNTSKDVALGMPVTKALLSNYQIGITTNAQGEERVKLVTKRVDISDLLD